jgi:hypothetical protein
MNGQKIRGDIEMDNPINEFRITDLVKLMNITRSIKPSSFYCSSFSSRILNN